LGNGIIGIGEERRTVTKREEELISEGWEKRFVACEPRLSEAAELYESIGFRVVNESLNYVKLV